MNGNKKEKRSRLLQLLFSFIPKSFNTFSSIISFFKDEKEICRGKKLEKKTKTKRKHGKQIIKSKEWRKTSKSKEKTTEKKKKKNILKE